MSKYMKALKDFKLRSTSVKAGDVFKVKDGDVRLLTSWKFAEEMKSPKQLYQTRDMESVRSMPEEPPLSSYTKARLQAMLEDRGLRWKAWESKAVLIERLKDQK